jgi:hypothetical protein
VWSDYAEPAEGDKDDSSICNKGGSTTRKSSRTRVAQSIDKEPDLDSLARTENNTCELEGIEQGSDSTGSADVITQTAYTPGKTDVILMLGRIKKKSHPGNLTYYELVKDNLDDFKRANTQERRNLCIRIFLAIKCQHPPGRFLKEARAGSGWYEMNEEEAMKSIYNAFLYRCQKNNYEGASVASVATASSICYEEPDPRSWVAKELTVGQRVYAKWTENNVRIIAYLRLWIRSPHPTNYAVSILEAMVLGECCQEVQVSGVEVRYTIR